jgi:hypothetical protein
VLHIHISIVGEWPVAWTKNFISMPIIAKVFEAGIVRALISSEILAVTRKNFQSEDEVSGTVHVH